LEVRSTPGRRIGSISFLIFFSGTWVKKGFVLTIRVLLLAATTKVAGHAGYGQTLYGILLQQFECRISLPASVERSKSLKFVFAAEVKTGNEETMATYRNV
jgi:hypothetical protein